MATPKTWDAVEAAHALIEDLGGQGREAMQAARDSSE